MNTTPATWRGWCSEIIQRIDRRVIVVGLGYAALSFGLSFIGHDNPAQGWIPLLAARALFWLATCAVLVLSLATAMVAVTRGASGWVVYPMAGLVATMVAGGLGLALHPHAWLVATPTPMLPAVLFGHTALLLGFFGPPSVLYVYASTAAHHEHMLRDAEIERRLQAERLAQQHLQTELATVDHDLMLKALRLALEARTGDAALADELLAAVTTYLRAAQQRKGSDASVVVQALEHLHIACARATALPHPVMP